MLFRRRQALVTFAALVASIFMLGAFAGPAPQSTPQPQVPQPAVPSVPVPPPPEFKSSSWVLMDYATGRVLASKDPDQRVEPASITKIMTDYVVSAMVTAGKVHMDDQVFISENAWKNGGAGTDGSTSFLKVHSKVPLKVLMEGLIVQSGNDAAIALAEHVAGSEQGFVSLMNAYAKRLGMKNTHYSNVSGYPVPNHYSTARDTAILSRALIHDFPADYKISSMKKVTINGITQYNRNSLLWRDPSVDGIKTGHTKEAGYCLAASAQREGQRLIAVVMGTPSSKARVDDAEALLNYGFRFFESHQLYKAGQVLASPRLWKGDKDQLPIGLTSDLALTVKRGAYEQLKASINLPATLIAPFKKGQQVGTLTISLDGKTLLTRPVVALADAPEGGFFSRLWDTILLWFHGGGAKQTTVKPQVAA
ncbi:MAG TPA: D-alanyl-D-alanine carboxypeptidase family protein [Rhodanobacteraceae bacterium]|nr:D-alanyl-D-alanine carboxypeptidase family protein [Rhodanobacteraceae bacterium]